MARTSSRKAQSQSQSVDFNKAETMAIGSFMKRLHGAGMEDITLNTMGDIRRLFRCLSVMKANAVKNLSDELSFEELAGENDKSFGFWNGESDNNFNNFA